MPPAPVRRLLAPVWVALAAVGSIASPVLTAIGALIALILRRPQPLLLVRFALIYLTREAAMLLACAGLWILSGFGRRLGEKRFQMAHYKLLAWLLDELIEPAFHSLDLELDAGASLPAQRALTAPDRPLLLFSRHAGPGDSLLILHLLLTRYGRLPRVVMKEQLAFDPVVDLLCRRLPNALIDPSDQDECEAQIGALARDLDGRSVLLLFPEGGNFSAERRVRAIDRLRRDGRRRRAEQAERMRHVLAPRPGGALAALRANPRLDVIFAAHTGLGHETFPGQLWRRLPAGQTLHMRMWLSTAAERPDDAPGQIEWLYEWWEHLDAWIHAQDQE